MALATPQRILVTGAAGFVGRHLLAALGAAFPDAAVLATARDPAPGCRVLDVIDAGAVAAAVAEFRPTACIHLAAVSAVPQAQRAPAVAWRVNLHGSLHLAEAILAHAPGCQFLFVSSSEVYGRSFTAGRPLDETALPAPMSRYAATKAAADLALGALAGEGLRVVRLRPFNHTGPGQSDNFAITAFARQVARIAAGLQSPQLDVGALDPQRDFLDVRDVCAAYVACLSRSEALPPGTILNIASGTPRRIGDVLADLLALAGVQASVQTRADLLRPVEIPTAAGDAARARALLGWAPCIPWGDTLAGVLADWRERVRAEPAATR